MNVTFKAIMLDVLTKGMNADREQRKRAEAQGLSNV